MSKEQTPAVKKGKPTWAPSDLLTVRDKEDGFRYRWLSKEDPAALMKAKAEGFQIVSELTSGAKRDGATHIQDGNQVTTVTEYRELILARIPVDVAEARADYFREKSASKIMGLKTDLADKLGSVSQGTGHNPGARGQIIIE